LKKLFPTNPLAPVIRIFFILKVDYNNIKVLPQKNLFMFKNLIYLLFTYLARIFVRKYWISNKNGYNYILNDYISYKTELDKLFLKHGSDKGGLVKSRFSSWYPHNFGNIYDNLFFRYRNKKFNFLEIGIGSTDKNIKSSLPTICKSGASLRAFRDYFYKANIYGLDIDPKTMFKENRINCFIVDQTSSYEVKNFFKKIKKSFLIIIDDGLHDYDANINFFNISIKYLDKNGYYIIEDINERKIDQYYDYFYNLKSNYRVNIYNIDNGKFIGRSNNLILIQKR